MASALVHDIALEVTVPLSTDWLYIETTVATVATDAKIHPANILAGANSVTLGSGLANQIAIAGSTTGNPVTLTATGSDADIAYQIKPKGDAGLLFSPYTTGAFITGYAPFAVFSTAADSIAQPNTIGTWAHYTAGESSVIDLVRSEGTVAVPTVLTANKVIGQYSFQGYDGAGSWPNAAKIYAVSEQDFTPTNSPGRLSFFTTAIGTTSLEERLRITSEGVLRLLSYTSNGFVKTGSGDGTLSVDTASYAPLTAPTFTAPVIITGVVGSSPFTIDGATQTANFPVLNLTQTWNNAGVTFEGFKLNVTSTASATASKLIDLQVGGATQFNVRKDGLTTMSGGAIIASGNSYSTSGRGGFAMSADGALQLFSNGFATNAVIILDATNILAQRSGTNAQTFRVYGTWTDTSNYERASLSHVTGTGVLLAAETAGTGADNLNITLTPAGTGNVVFPGGVLLKTGAALTDGAGASAGTLANAPAVGNPTKWIPINDNGTTRHIPAW